MSPQSALGCGLWAYGQFTIHSIFTWQGTFGLFEFESCSTLRIPISRKEVLLYVVVAHSLGAQEWLK